MFTDTLFVIYLMAYIITIIYLAAMGCVMLVHKDHALVMRGELEAKRRLTRTMAVSMFIVVFESLLYLPPMLLGYPGEHLVYKILFLVVLMLSLPMVYHMMMALVQRRANTLRWSLALSVPYLILIGCYALVPRGESDRTLLYIAVGLAALSLVFLLLHYVGEYRNYQRRLQSEYSELTRRELLWSWFCFGGFALQCILFVSYQLVWAPWLDVLYLAVSIPNATFLCYSICRQRTLDLDVLPDAEPDAPVEAPADDKAFYANIEERLRTLCEDKLLFLDPELTRETLSRHLAINRTYLSMYFRQRGLTYYQYVNALRVEYAVRLMQENPEMPIGEVSRQSGFRTQTTFRKVFQEEMGCLPSEVRR